MQEALLQLKAVLDAIGDIPEEQWNSLSAIWKPFSAKRREVLTVNGAPERYLYFVLEGVQRVYYFDESDREATIVFTYPPSFGGVLDAFMLQEPSRYFYETLTASQFIRTTYTELQHVMQSSPALQSVITKGITQSLSGLMLRLAELQCFSSEEKFRALLKRSPHILQLVPHKYLANYLGIDATNFSKLINRIRI